MSYILFGAFVKELLEFFGRVGELDSSISVMFGEDKVWCFDQETGNQECAVQGIDVDVLMEWEQTSSFFFVSASF